MTELKQRVLFKGPRLYEGKAKIVFSVVDDSDLVWIQFKDSMTAFNAQKKEEMRDKGRLNKQISQLIFRYLEEQAKVPTAWVSSVSDTEIIMQKVKIIPLEVICRNRVAGSLAKRFGLAEGEVLKQPLIEICLKDDLLGDPLMTPQEAVVLGFADEVDLQEIFAMARVLNERLSHLFTKIGFILVDFKVEFGRNNAGQLVLADEISPDCTRLWDVQTHEKFDKDRFRRDLGGVIESYQEVLNRLTKELK